MACYMGVDPGVSTGIAVYDPANSSPWSVFQVNGRAAPWLIDSVLVDFKPVLIAVEAFEVRNSAGTKGKDAELTRFLAHYARQAAERNPDRHYVERLPGQVKPWATDKRLTKTGFPLGTKFRDARDAGRHALYAAVRDGNESDPLR